MKTIPNFSTFALTNKDQNVVNVVTGKIKSPKTGTNKYQLFDDNKKSHTLTIEQIKALTVTPENKPKTIAKEGKPKVKIQVTKVRGEETKAAVKKTEGEEKVSKKDQILALYKEGKTPAEIEEATGIKANTAFVAIKIHRIMSLHAKGKTPAEIAEKTGYKVDSVKWQIEKSGGR